jgi:peptide deformylase
MRATVALLVLALPADAFTAPPQHHRALTASHAVGVWRIGAVRMKFDAEMFAQYANPAAFEDTNLLITEFPNPILRAPNAEVTEFDDKLQELCKECFSVMYGANGVGLAAPQVGMNIQLFVYNCDPKAPGSIKKMGEKVVCNPKILEFCQATETDIEGCLSSRSECCRGDIRRFKELQVEYQDERGRVKRRKLRGFEARVFQHEYDHLQGVLHIDRQSAADRRASQTYLDKLIELHGPGGELEPRPEVAAAMQPPPFSLTLEPPPVAKPTPARAPSRGGTSEGASAAPKAKAGFGGFGGGVGAGASGKKGKSGAKKKKR